MEQSEAPKFCINMARISAKTLKYHHLTSFELHLIPGHDGIVTLNNY